MDIETYATRLDKAGLAEKLRQLIRTFEGLDRGLA